MSLAIWPASPLPAGLQRNFRWNMSEARYDSGAYQAMTPYQRPLYGYTIPYVNFNEVKQAIITAFSHQQRRQGNAPFLMKDPYDYRANSVLVVGSGFSPSSGTTYLYDTNSFFVRADTTTVGSFFSALSGYVRNGFEYSYVQDTGVLNVSTKAVNDTWGARSMEYYRKCIFANDYQEQAIVWNVFGANIAVEEVI